MTTRTTPPGPTERGIELREHVAAAPVVLVRHRPNRQPEATARGVAELQDRIAVKRTRPPAQPVEPGDDEPHASTASGGTRCAVTAAERFTSGAPPTRRTGSARGSRVAAGHLEAPRCVGSAVVRRRRSRGPGSGGGPRPRDQAGELPVDRWECRDAKGSPQLSIYVELLERAQDRTLKALTELVKLGVEERLVKLTERQGEAIVTVLLGALGEFDLSVAEDDVKHAVDRHLELVAGEARG